MSLRCGVYWNSHKRLFSIRNEDVSTQETPDYHYGKVIAHAQHVWLGQSTFHVSEAGRDRANNEGRKNVHARVLGHVIAIGGRWHFPHSAGEGKLLRDRYCNIDLYKSTIALISARAKVDADPSLGANGIWDKADVYSIHYDPWSGPAAFSTFTNKGVWAVEYAEAVELSCMIADTDTEETLRRPCITVPVTATIITEIEETTNVTETV